MNTIVLKRTIPVIALRYKCLLSAGHNGKNAVVSAMQGAADLYVISALSVLATYINGNKSNH